MEQILVEYEFPSSSTALLAKTLEAYRRRFAIPFVMKQGSQITRTDIAGCTLYISVRGNAYLAAMLMKTAQKMGKACLAFIDDDLILLPRTGIFAEIRRNSFREVLANANAILCVHPMLGEKYAPLTIERRFICFDTILPGDMFISNTAINKRHTDTVTLLYAANATHAVFFQTYIAPILGNVARQAHRPLRLVFMGVRPQLDPLPMGITVEFYGVQAYDVYRQRLLAGEFDIGVAPLEPNGFTGMKYYNKFIDYASAGIAGIYTDCMPYTMVVESGRNGLLCAADPAAWEKALVAMVTDDTLRRRCAQNALEDAHRLCAEDRNLSLIRQGIALLQDGAQKNIGYTPHIPTVRFAGQVFVLAEQAAKACGIAARAGLPAMVGKIKSHMRARKAFTGSKPK